MIVWQCAAEAEHRWAGSMTMTEIADPWPSASRAGVSEAYACSSLPLQRIHGHFSFDDERLVPYRDTWRQAQQSVATSPAPPCSESEDTMPSTDDQRLGQHPSFSTGDHEFAAPRTVPRHPGSRLPPISTGHAEQDDKAQTIFEYLPTPPTSRSTTMDSCSLDHYPAYGLEEDQAALQSDQTTDLLDGSQTTKTNIKREGTISKASPKGTRHTNSLPSHGPQWLDSDQLKDGLRTCFIDTTIQGSGTNKYQISNNSDSVSRLDRLRGVGSLEASRGRVQAVGGDIATQVTTTAENGGFAKQTNGNQTGGWPGGGGSSENKSKTNQKRRMIPTGYEDDYDDSGKDGDKSKKKRLQKEEAETKRFACPFFKHNPEGYRTSRTCMGPGWPTVQRVKEHLLRRHQLPEYQCPRCFDDFTSEPKYRDHVRRPEACSTRAQPLEKEGINKEQAELLKKRKKNGSAKTEEDRWNEVYSILFPTEAVPSPYYEPEVSASRISPDIMAQCRTLREQILKRLVEVMRKDIGEDSPGQVQSFIQDQRLESSIDNALQEVLGSDPPESPPQAAQEASAESSQETHILWDDLNMLHDPSMAGFGFDSSDFLTVPEMPSASGSRNIESTSTMPAYEFGGASSMAGHVQPENEPNYVWGPLNDA